MTISHAFLNEFDGSAKADRIAALPEWRKKQIVQRCFPGTDVGGLGYHEALNVADAAFEVRESKIYADGNLAVTSHKAVVRNDNHAVVGCVGKDFGVIQHREALSGLSPLCDNNDLTLESIQVRDGGSSVVATALLGFSKIHVPGRDHGDALAHFARIANAHDGSGSAVGGLYTLRLTCLNGQTSNAALQQVRVRHSKHAAGRVTDIHACVRNAIEAAKAEVAEFQQLAESKIALEDFIVFANDLLTDVRGEADTDRKRVRREKDVTDIADLFCEGQGNQGENKYDAYNAITEWLTPRQERYADASKYASKFKADESGNGRVVRQRAIRQLLRA